MSTWEQIPATSGSVALDTLKDEIAVAKNRADESKATMATLLRDVYSVETQFIFTQDKSCSDFGLWAHRSILSKYQVFDELLKAAAKQSDKNIDVGPLTLIVDKVSFTTFCALLMFIYTGEIERNIDPTRFAISQIEPPTKTAGTHDNTVDVTRWHPLNLNSPWDLKPVSWDNLLFAADLYKIEELRILCQKHLIETISANNAVENLINVGPKFPEIKEATVDYISKNMKTMFVSGEDPFAPYVHHPKCHELLVEVLLRVHSLQS